MAELYGWLWRAFPGGWIGKLLCSFGAVVVALLLLFLVVFPRVEPLLPYQDVTVTPAPSATPHGAAG